MAFEKGMIIMFSGDTIPMDWYLCDGENGTPDLRDRFIIGSSIEDIHSKNNVSFSGGKNDKKITIPTSKTTISASVSIAEHSLLISELPAHSHKNIVEGDSNNVLQLGSGGVKSGDDRFPVSTNTGYKNIVTTSVGGGRGHSHNGTLSNQSPHGHDIDMTVPYYAMAFIQYHG